MLRRLTILSPVVVFATIILLASIFRSASVKYSFHLPPSSETIITVNTPKIDYSLPSVGAVGPKHPLWPLEVGRDKIWLFINRDYLRKAEIALLLADKRLSYADHLMGEGNVEFSMSVARKSEMYLEESCKYLEKAEEHGANVLDFTEKLSLASLKHREVLETMLTHAPEDAKPILIQILNISKGVYEKTTHLLNKYQRSLYTNPFKS